jgi:DNA-directed RNA polymerase specialized sigma24 family protein
VRGDMDDAGGSASFESRFDELFALAIKPAWRLLGDRQEAENIAAEVLARALVRWNTLAGSPNLRGWVVTVSTNLAIGHLRKCKRWSPLIGVGGDHRPSPIDDRLDLDSALCTISGRQRDALVLRYYLDYSEADIAGTMGISVSSVKTHLQRGLRALRLLLNEPREPQVAPD